MERPETQQAGIQRAGNLVLFGVGAVVVGALVVWLDLLGGAGPGEAQRRGARYSVEPGALLSELDARVAALDEDWRAGQVPAIYEAARGVREGFRSLLRAAASDDVEGASLTTYMPHAEALVQELEAEFEARRQALLALPDELRDRFSDGARALEPQLSQFMRILRRDGAPAARADYEAFRAAYDAWRAGLTLPVPNRQAEP